MTEPRPRLANRIGSVQQTSVVTVENRPNNAGNFERMIPPIAETRRTQAERLAWVGYQLRERIRLEGGRRADAEGRAAA